MCNIAQNVSKQRIIHYYYLALSIEHMLETPSSNVKSTIKGALQLMEEYEFFTSGLTMQGMKMIMAKTASCPYPQLAPTIPKNNDDEDQLRPFIHKYQNTVVYEYLKTPHIGKNSSKSRIYVSIFILKIMYHYIILSYVMLRYIAFELDYTETMVALFDSLRKLYDKFLMEDSCRYMTYTISIHT